jgi:hypothetical protein
MAEETGEEERLKSALRASLWGTAYYNYTLPMNEFGMTLAACFHSVIEVMDAVGPLEKHTRGLSPEAGKAILDMVNGLVKVTLSTFLEGCSLMFGKEVDLIVNSLSREVKALNGLSIPTPEEAEVLASIETESSLIRSKLSDLKKRLEASATPTNEAKEALALGKQMNVFFRAEASVRDRLFAKAVQIREKFPSLVQGVSVDELSKLTMEVLIPPPRAPPSPPDLGAGQGKR